MNDLDALCDLPGFAPLRLNPAAKVGAFDSLTKLIDLAIEYKRKEDQENCIYFFRGEGACFPESLASLFTPDAKCECEHEYYQAALSSAPDYFYPLKTTFDRLSQMRHYAFPTRILDITENILTAWFMALDSWVLGNRGTLCKHPEIQKDNDPFPCPRVIVFKIPRGRIKEAESDLVMNLSCLAKLKDEFTIGQLWHEIKQERHDFYEDVFWDCFGDLFTNWCVRPRMTNPRALNQQGAYILFGLSEQALNGRSIYGFRDTAWRLKKSNGKFAPLGFSAHPMMNERTLISIEGYLMPSQSVLRKHQTFEDWIWDARKELEFIGVDSHTMYRDDFEKYAEHWKTVIKRRYEATH